MTDKADSPPTRADIETVRAAERKRAAGRARRNRDVIDVRRPDERKQDPKKPREATPPTPEQAQRADYELLPIHERKADGGLTLQGRAYKRQVAFERIEGLTVPQIMALRRYRRDFDESEISEVKSQLDVGTGGGSGGSHSAIVRIEKIAFAGQAVARIEALVPRELLATLRAVALHDMDFKHVAMERFGSRTVQRVDTSGKHAKVVTSLEPRSGRDRQRVREEFLVAAEALAKRPPRAHVAAVLPDDAIEVSTDHPLATEIDPAFVDGQGKLRQWSEIRQIILDRWIVAGLPGCDEAA